MAKKLDIAGMKFGKLTAIERGEPVIVQTNVTTWVCRCDCGGAVTVPTSRLRAGINGGDPAWRSVTSCLECSIRKCQECGVSIINPTAPNQKYCTGCKPAAVKKNLLEYSRRSDVRAVQKEKYRKMREAAAKWLAQEAAQREQPI